MIVKDIYAQKVKCVVFMEKISNLSNLNSCNDGALQSQQGQGNQCQTPGVKFEE